ncbi:MAG: hypothetical protein ACI4S4_04530 [Candidatus Ornithospirochaeta sp.]
MQYITVVADSYEEAVQKARNEYGDSIRIHSRRDFTTPGGLFTRRMKKCEITCYISSVSREKDKVEERDMNEFEKEAKTPDPKKLSKEERLNTEIHRGTEEGYKEAVRLLDENYISGSLRAKLLEGFSCPVSECARTLSERILENTRMDYEAQIHPSRVVVFLGPTGAGKTTTLAKVAWLYKNSGKRVGIVTLDSYRVGAYEQIKAFAEALNIPVEMVGKEDQLMEAMEKFSYFDLVLVDTMGLSSKDLELNLRLKGLGLQLQRMNTSFTLIVSASMKEEDMMRHYQRYKDDFNITSIIVTKLDESITIGNALSFAYSISKPILFFTDGQKVPEDLERASTEVILGNLRGFGLDMRAYRGQL